MKRHVLIEVMEQDIHVPEVFDTEEQAVDEMLNRLSQVTEIARSKIDACEPNEDGYHVLDDYDAIYSENFARCERHGENYDWKIFELDI